MAMNQPKVQKEIPTTGATVQIMNSDNNILLRILPTADLAALTVSFPPNPHPGQLVVVSSSKVIGTLTQSGGTFDKLVSNMAAVSVFVYAYDDQTSTWSLVISSKATKIFLPYTATTTAGTAIIYLTDTGLVTGKALFLSVDYVHLDFILNDPNLGKSYVLSSDLKTLTITAVKQSFTGITVLGINVIGSVAIAAAATGTILSVLVQGNPV